jgi:hypothetical protein
MVKQKMKNKKSQKRLRDILVIIRQLCNEARHNEIRPLANQAIVEYDEPSEYFENHSTESEDKNVQ